MEHVTPWCESEGGSCKVEERVVAQLVKVVGWCGKGHGICAEAVKVGVLVKPCSFSEWEAQPPAARAVS